MMGNATRIARGLRAGDRAAVLGVLAGLATLSWAYMLHMEWGMRHMDVGADMAIMPAMTNWGIADLCLVLLMWTIMMSAMMLPSAVPMVLAYVGIQRARGENAQRLVSASLLVIGYLIVWLGFSLAATVLQWALLETALITPMMDSASTTMSGLFLIGAGVFQFTPLKRACLIGCRSPVHLLLSAWQESQSGAIALGLKNGATCLGCCWALMLLPLALGVMDLRWMVALTGFILIEKALPGGDRFGRTVGWALIFWGGVLLVRHFVS